MATVAAARRTLATDSGKSFTDDGEQVRICFAEEPICSGVIVIASREDAAFKSRISGCSATG